MYKPTISLILPLIILCCVDVARACTCVSTPSPCSSFKDTPVVFVGVVTSIKEDKVDIVRFGEKVTVRTGLLASFSVEEPLKGIKQNTVDVATGGGGGDCGYPFKAGKRYLVYAYNSEGAALNSSISRTVIGGKSGMSAQLTASICSRTRPLKYAADDIELIRALNSGKSQTRIFGRVAQFARKLGTYEYNIDHVGPLTDLKIKAENSDGHYEATTDREGHYKITDLKPGKYKVSVLLPDGYGPLFEFDGTSENVHITSEACGIEVNFDAQIDGRISGHVFDSDGSPVTDNVQVSIVTLESSTKGIALAESRSEYTKNKGWYEFDGLQPGKYLLGINIARPPDKHSPYPMVYFPNTSDRTQARVFTISVGEKLKNIDFHLPPKLPEITLSGVVVRPNGTPVVEAQVDIYDQEDAQRSLGFSWDVKTDRRGRFTLRCFKGRRYWLHAWKDKDYLAGTGEQSEMIEVDTRGVVQQVKLILSKPGIFRKKRN